jgi:pyridoxine 4-dehydrogenase
MTSPGDSPAEPTRAGAACPGGPGPLAGRTVARIGYGAMQLRNLRHDRGAAIALLRRAVELGVNHIDTAQFYGDGLVNDLIPAGIACVQNEYSLVSRGEEDMLRLCAGAGIAWVPFFPLGGALPGSPKVADQPAVVAAAESLRCAPAQVSLAWLLRHAPNVLLIPGTTSPGHLEENLAAGAIAIDTATLAALDAIRAMA